MACPLQCHIIVILSNREEKKKLERNIWAAWRRDKSKHDRFKRWTQRAGPDTDAVPLWVGLVVFVSLVFNHSVAADANVWPGNLHPIQSDPATHRDTTSIIRGSKRKTNKERDKRERHKHWGGRGAAGGFTKKLNGAENNYYPLIF